MSLTSIIGIYIFLLLRWFALLSFLVSCHLYVHLLYCILNSFFFCKHFLEIVFFNLVNNFHLLLLFLGLFGHLMDHLQFLLSVLFLLLQRIFQVAVVLLYKSFTMQKFALQLLFVALFDLFLVLLSFF